MPAPELIIFNIGPAGVMDLVGMLRQSGNLSTAFDMPAGPSGGLEEASDKRVRVQGRRLTGLRE